MIAQDESDHADMRMHLHEMMVKKQQQQRKIIIINQHLIEVYLHHHDVFQEINAFHVHVSKYMF